MKSLVFAGFLLCLIGAFLIYLNPNFSLPLFSGGIMGLGFGFIIGGIVGYSSKGSQMKYQQKMNELKELKQKINESPK